MSSFDINDSLLVLCFMGWGVLMALCLFLAIIRALFSCIQKIYDGDYHTAGVQRYSGGETLELYRTMSSARKEEIDNLRKNALLRYLSRFTLEVGDEHLLCCSGLQTDTTLSISESEEEVVSDESVTSNRSCKFKERHRDIEEGNNIVIETEDNLVQPQSNDSRCDITQDNSNATATDSAVEYTHISIPFPGFDIAGINICSIAEAEKGSKQKRKKRKLPWLFRSGSNNVGGESQTEQTESAAIDNYTNQKQMILKEKRRVPIFCAICLEEYEKNDRVCWSSNAECSHVFHESCILQWLISSGKKRSMNHQFTRHPSDKELLGNEFCPCCRQDFICVNTSAAFGSEESV